LFVLELSRSDQKELLRALAGLKRSIRSDGRNLSPGLQALAEALAAALARTPADTDGQERPKPKKGAGGGYDAPVTKPLVASVVEAAQYLGIAPKTVQRRIADGTLPSQKIGGRRIVSMAALEDLVNGEKACA
jgi:excisionase family DNA binding protein